MIATTLLGSMLIPTYDTKNIFLRVEGDVKSPASDEDMLKMVKVISTTFRINNHIIKINLNDFPN